MQMFHFLAPHAASALPPHPGALNKIVRKAMPRRAEWDSSLSDLSVHRISRAEQEERRKRIQSPNAVAARKELERRRTLLARCSFDDTLSALASQGPEASSALRELETVEKELGQLAGDACNGPASMVAAPRPPTIVVASAPGEGVEAEEALATPPTPAFLQGREAPWAAERPAPFGAAGAPTRPSTDAFAAPPPPAVDLDEEIALFRERSGLRLAALGREAAEGGAPATAAAAAAAIVAAAPNQRAASAAIDAAAPRLGQAYSTAAAGSAAEATAEAAVGVDGARLSFSREGKGPPPKLSAPAPAPAKTPPWRPANGKLRHDDVRGRGGEPSPPAGGARAPDTLGLARMQHACHELAQIVDEYETCRAAAPNDAASNASVGGDETGGLHKRAVASAAASAAPSSYSNCHAQLVELTKRLVAHLQRADAELSAQSAQRARAERELEGSKAAIAQQADLAATECAALRREVRLLREAHAAQLEALAVDVASLKSSREVGFLASLASSLQQGAPSSPPTAPAVSSALPATEAVPSTTAEASDAAAAPPLADATDAAVAATFRVAAGAALPAALSTPPASASALDRSASPPPPPPAPGLADRSRGIPSLFTPLAMAPLPSQMPPTPTNPDATSGGAERRVLASAASPPVRRRSLVLTDVAADAEDGAAAQGGMAADGTFVTAAGSAAQAHASTATAADPPRVAARPHRVPAAWAEDAVAPRARTSAVAAERAIDILPHSEPRPRLSAAPQRVLITSPAHAAAVPCQISGMSVSARGPRNVAARASSTDAFAPGVLVAEEASDPSWVHLGPADPSSATNDERSQQVLHKYYEEVARGQRSAHGTGAVKPRAAAAPTAGQLAAVTAAANRRLSSGRAGRVSMEPTQLIFDAQATL